MRDDRGRCEELELTAAQSAGMCNLLKDSRKKSGLEIEERLSGNPWRKIDRNVCRVKDLSLARNVTIVAWAEMGVRKERCEIVDWKVGCESQNDVIVVSAYVTVRNVDMNNNNNNAK